MANKGRPPSGLNKNKFLQWHDISNSKGSVVGRLQGSRQKGVAALGGVDAANSAYAQYKQRQDNDDRDRDKIRNKAGRKRLHEGTLVYPQDLAGNEFYPEAIKFTVFKRKGASLDKVMSELGQIGSLGAIAAMQDDDKNKPADMIAEEQRKAAADLQIAGGINVTQKSGESLEAWTERVGISARENIEAINSRIDFWNNAKVTGNTSTFDIMKQSGNKLKRAIMEGTKGLRQNTFNQLTSKAETGQIMGEVYMNMPNEINFNEEASWGGTDLGVVGGLAKGDTAEAAIGTAFANFSNVAGGGTAALGALALQMGKHGAMAGAVLGTLGGEAMQKGLESGTSQVANPYKEMTFSGIGFRQFSFNFTFRARNEKEVEVIQDIIETFRYYSKPTYTHGKSGFFTYPEEFLIEFLMKTGKHGCETFETNHFVPQLKMCVLKTVTTNFAPQNAWRTFRDSSPVEISLALSFEETEVVTGEDVVGATPVGRFKDSGRKF